MQSIKINNTYKKSFQSIEGKRHFSVLTPEAEKAKALIAKEINEPSIVQILTNAVGKMLRSRKFSRFGVQECVTIAVDAYRFR